MHAAHTLATPAPKDYVFPPAEDPMFHNVPLCASAKPGIPPLNGDDNQNVLTLYPHLSTLTPIQARALALLLQGHSLSSAARKLDLNRHTIARWKHHHPAFIAELNRQQEEMLSQTTILCRRALRKSFRRIHAVLDDTASPDSLRVAMSLARSSMTSRAFTRDPGPTNVISVVDAMAAQQQQMFADGYHDSYVHQDMAHRLARLDLAPNPIPTPPPVRPDTPANPAANPRA